MLHIELRFVSLRRNLGQHFVLARLQINLGGDGSITPRGSGTGTDNVVASLRSFFLQNKLKLETILAFQALEVAVVQLDKLHLSASIPVARTEQDPVLTCLSTATTGPSFLISTTNFVIE